MTERHAEANRLLSLGFKLVPLLPMSKQPAGGKSWNRHPATHVDPKIDGYGMLLAANGLCSIDPDHMQLAREGLARCGFDLDELMAAGVRTSSTRPGSGGRSTFRAPSGLAWLPFRSKTQGTILELRASSANLQDTLPGTTYHGKGGSGPFTQAYAGTLRLDEAPELPAALAAWWRRMSKDLDYRREQERLFSEGDAVLSVSNPTGAQLAFGSLHRRAFNAAHDVPSILESHGYTTTDSERWAPSTATGAPCVREIPGKDGLWQSDHGSDPLHGTFDAWTAHVVLDYGGDQAAAERACEASAHSAVAAEFDVVTPPPFKGNVDDLFSSVMLRQEDVEKMTQPVFLIPDMIVQGHLAAFAAPGNGGKTTLFLHFSAQLARVGCKVLYVNADGSPGDLIRHHAHAVQHGYSVIAPDAREGKSAADVMKIIEQLARGQQPLDGVVFIVDTLKKFVDVINKTRAKELYRTLRTLTVRGATVCLLCHTNKYAGADGLQIFEGTGDLRSDVDELIYLDSVKNEDEGTLEITSRPDKVRAAFGKRSFVIHLEEDRRVEEVSHVLAVRTKEVRTLEKHLRDAILAGEQAQAGIVTWVQARTGQSSKKIRETLLRLSAGEGAPFAAARTGRGTDLKYSLREEAADALW